ncbi:uncharacterized protein LOC134241172 [Saccostrea cucullata]|uniref:uncharacterized protein LOC134241172 n=1 Tax=Saccostrea cuccullata TaxID=36930 RepID=UPI002ED25992
MFKKIIFKKKPKPKVDKSEDPPPSTSEPDYDVIDPTSNPSSSIYTPLLPCTPIPKHPRKSRTTGKIFNKDSIVDLPLQHVSCNRRMEDLDDEEYGYASGYPVQRVKKKDTNWEDTFLDAQKFTAYQKDSNSPMISKFFFSSQEQLYEEVFNILSCKNKLVRHLCINELTNLIVGADQKNFSTNEMKIIYQSGTAQLFTVIAETKKTFSNFHSLIQLGIIFNCFIYLRAIEAVDQWIACIKNTITTIQSRSKRVFERSDPDVQVFAKTAKCIFDLEEVDLDESLLMGEDVNDLLPDFNREDSHICIEGLAVVFHTGNLVLRQQSKFHTGVQKMVGLASFMDVSNDEEGVVKWHHRLLGLFIVRILQEEHPDVKLEMLEKCENQLLSILNGEHFHSSGFSVSKSLLFHHNERIRSRYREIAKRKGTVSSKEAIKDHVQNLLKNYGFVFDLSTTELPLNNSYERKQCLFCNVDASITCFLESFADEVRDVELYDNTSSQFNTSLNLARQENLENELEVLKEIESKDIHKNVARLLAFNQTLPKFYIKERLPGDNLQRRLLEARDKGKIIPIENLIKMIVQAVEAVLYVHSCGCLIRDITTSSYCCATTDNGYFLKLKNFEMAAKPSDFPSDGIVSGLIDLDFEGVPIRWAAPESLLEGHYSIYSDVWSVNILADEILNYAAWPYSDVSDSDIDDMITNIVFTHLKPQGFNRPRRVQGLILEGLATIPEQRLKLEALRERLLDISSNISGEGSYTLYDTYSGVEGTHAKVYEIPPLTERQIKANSVFERGIPKSIRRFRELDEDPVTVFALEVAENNNKLKEQSGVKVMEISSDEYYKIETEDRTSMMKVMEKVSEDFLKFTYNRLKEIDSSKMCVEPWPPTKSVSADGSKQLHYKFPRSTHLLDIVLHKERGQMIGPYIELLYELANHIDSFHTAGWIFRCLRAKNVWILETKKREQTIVVPKFGKYRVIASSEFDTHLEQIKVEKMEDTEGIQWLPIEAIKAGLYSKESDVYAFGMITWEVMSAFGQEGVVYDQDEERELLCVPFNYQESEKILQHLIEGYIPEKQVKCPDWFYQEVTRPCLLHQKIDRPSMKTILQILEIRLGKTLPKQVLSLPPPPQPAQPGGNLTPNVEQYEDIYDYDDKELKESATTEGDGKVSSNEVPPLPQPRRPPPPPPASYYNTNENKDNVTGKHNLPPPPPTRPKPIVKANDVKDTEDNSGRTPPPVSRMGNKTDAEDKVNVCLGGVKVDDTVPPVPTRPLPSSTGNQKESTRSSDVNSCKVLPLPNIPQSNKDERIVNVPQQPSAVNLPPKSQEGQRGAYQNLKEQTSGDTCSANCFHQSFQKVLPS